MRCVCSSLSACGFLGSATWMRARRPAYIYSRCSSIRWNIKISQRASAYMRVYMYIHLGFNQVCPMRINPRTRVSNTPGWFADIYTHNIRCVGYLAVCVCRDGGFSVRGSSDARPQGVVGLRFSNMHRETLTIHTYIYICRFL